MIDDNNNVDEQFHLAHKAGDEKRLMQFHQELEDVIEVQYRARIFKLLRNPRIDFKEPIPPCCVVWRVCTTTLFLLGS
jgi:hypothetical protein